MDLVVEIEPIYVLTLVLLWSLHFILLAATFADVVAT